MNEFKDSLRKKGLKATAARIAVLKVLEESRKPLDIQSIFARIVKMRVDADQATIYRIIENFARTDLVKRVQFQQNKAYYETAKSSDHHHAVCIDCGKVEDISRCSIQMVEREIELTKGFEVTSHSLEFFGKCKDCRDKQ